MFAASTPLRAFAIAALCLSVETVAADRPERIAGKPNLEGMWTGGTLTPFERPAQLSGKEYLAQEELEGQNRVATERYWAAGHRPDDVGRDNDAFIDDDLTILPSGQTSLVVDPPNGLLPLRPEAERRRDFNVQSTDTFETMSQWDRCITREPTVMFPVIYNNAYQIVQTPDHVVIHAEMIHDARIVPLQGKPIDARVRSWSGDPRGRWDGETLVIETRNFNEGGWLTTGLNFVRLRGVPYGKDLRIVERFKLLDRDTLDYRITIEDPSAFTSAWTMAFPLKRDDSYRMYEYACHEGNSAIELILRGARVQEAQKQSQ